MADYYSGNGAAAASGNGYSQGPGPGRDDDKKLFVGGLGWQTTAAEVQEYFGQYGEVVSVNLKVDAETGRSRGFCFVTFSGTDAVQKVLANTDHAINGRKVEAKIIKSRQAKLFVGGLKAEMSDDDVRQHFESFGRIAQLDMPMDKVKNQRKGFCFITFENENDVRNLVKTGKTTICGVEVGVKKATPRPAQGMDPHAAAAHAGYHYGGGGYGYGAGGGYGYDDGYGGYGAGYDDGYLGGYEDYGYGGYDESYGGGYGAGGGYGGYGGGYGASPAAAAPSAGGGYKPRGAATARGGVAGAPAAASRGGPMAGRGGAVRGVRGGRGRARPQPY